MEMACGEWAAAVGETVEALASFDFSPFSVAEKYKSCKCVPNQSPGTFPLLAEGMKGQGMGKKVFFMFILSHLLLI